MEGEDVLCEGEEGKEKWKVEEGGGLFYSCFGRAKKSQSDLKMSCGGTVLER